MSRASSGFGRLLLLLVAAAALAGAGCRADGGAVGVATSEYLTATCAMGTTTRGIDVSHHQGVINWDAVAGSGVRFAFIRVSDGTRSPDTRFTANWGEARRVGILRGAYQYFRPAQDVAAQANLMIAALASDGGELAPVIDVEDAGGRSAAQITAAVQQWVSMVSAATGRTPIIYTGPYFWRDQVGNPNMSGNPLWIAHYTSRCPLISEDVWSRWDFWQYSETGRVPGITGGVDMDLFNGTLEDLRALASGMPPPPPPPPPSGGELAWPMDTHRVTSNVSHVSSGRLVNYACTSISRAGHKGTDFGVARGTAVRASATGTVIRAVDGCSEGATSCGGGFGNHVMILHAGGRVTLYAHMTSGSLEVRNGETVECGRQLGTSGNTGHSTGPHLHYEVRDGVTGSGSAAVSSYYARPPTDPFGGTCSSQATDLWGASCSEMGTRDDSEYVSSTYPRTVVVAPGATVTQAWRLRNTGTTTWREADGYHLTHVEGPTLDGVSNVGIAGGASIAPRGETRFEVTVRAPTAPGDYTATYQMTRGPGTFGARVSIALRVSMPRSCTSATLGRSVPSGTCVQVSYAGCGATSCGWYVCGNGAWACTAPENCTGDTFENAMCAPRADCTADSCGDCTAREGCGWCDSTSSCMPVEDRTACGGEAPSTDPACGFCLDMGYACAEASQCCGYTAGGTVDCIHGFCEDTSMCGLPQDTCVDGDPASRCCGVGICSRDEGGTSLCCLRPGDGCSADEDCCGYMTCDATGHCRGQAVGEPCVDTQECGDGASYCTGAGVCGFEG